MATVYVPIRTIALQQASNPGNAYWKKVNFTNWEWQGPALKPNVESKVWGLVTVPYNLSPSGATKQVVLDLRASAGAGSTAKIRIATAKVESDPNAPENFDVTFTAESVMNHDRPAFSNGCLVRSIQNLSITIFPDEDPAPHLVVELFRDGDDAADTVEADLELFNWYLACEI